VLDRADVDADQGIQQGPHATSPAMFWKIEPGTGPQRFPRRNFGERPEVRSGKTAAGPAADGWRNPMTLLKWALIFFVISVIAGILGFTGVSAASADIARFLFYIFVVIFLILLILGLTIFRA
jgi:uncharacterized membrane protein YtjA (UPF0391 family)